MTKETFKNKNESPEQKEALEKIHEKIDFDMLKKEISSVFGEIEPEENSEDIKKDLMHERGEDGNLVYTEEQAEDLSKDMEEDIKDFNKEREKNIEGVVEALAKLVLEFKEKAHEYDAILSDETSARIMSLIMRKVLNKQLESEGKDKLPLYFVASGRSFEPESLGTPAFLEEHKGEFKKVLVVTEYVTSGKSMVNFIQNLKEDNIDYDVAVLSTAPSFKNAELYPVLKDEITVGKENSYAGLVFYNKKKYTGVSKLDPHYKLGQPHPEKIINSNIDGEVNEARKDSNTIAEELYKLL